MQLFLFIVETSCDFYYDTVTEMFVNLITIKMDYTLKILLCKPDFEFCLNNQIVWSFIAHQIIKTYWKVVCHLGVLESHYEQHLRTALHGH